MKGKTKIMDNKPNYKTKLDSKVTKEQKPKKKPFKHKKGLIIALVCLAVVIAAIIIVPKLLQKNVAATRVVTYSVKEVSEGSVTQTISGSGTLTPIFKDTLTSTKGGEVEEVNYTVGDEVEADAVIAVINGEDIVAPYDGILLELPIAAGDEVAVGGSVAMIMGKDGFTMGIAVDETEIKSVAMGQEVTFTIDALDKEYTGSVTSISYNGSSSGGSVAFSITATVEYVEGVYPGMSASAKIVIEDSGEGLLVPVDAVNTSGDDNYVYLAPSGAVLGDEYDEAEIDSSSLTKVYVDTGMSDGSYIIIESDELSDGSKILIRTITSTATGSENDSSNNGWGGSFPGGGEGMNFGDFDFENFDPSQMPSGGGGGFPGGGGR